MNGQPYEPSPPPQPVQRNPFPIYGQHSATIVGWRYVDEAGICSRVYPSQTDALYALLREVCPPWYVKVWKGIKEGWQRYANSTSTTTGPR